jgi:hypothetical protein
MTPTLTLSRAVLVLHGISPDQLRHDSHLNPDAVHALKPWLEEYGFDIKWPIEVHQLPEQQGFHLTQSPGYH